MPERPAVKQNGIVGLRICMMDILRINAECETKLYQEAAPNQGPVLLSFVLGERLRECLDPNRDMRKTNYKN
jgi:hypothetical protein